MYKHILIPLDGSVLAESALKPALCIARIFGSRITLIHVIEEDVSPTIHGDRHLSSPEEAHIYLETLARQVFPPEIPVEFHVHTGKTSDVARGIVGHQQEFSHDLIVMCSHGRGGLKSVVFGSIAQQVVAAGDIPVLLVRPETVGEHGAFECRVLLAPTDGESAHETGLQAAAELALASGARLHLLSVVPTTGTLSGRQAAERRLMPGATRAALELEYNEVSIYLENKVHFFHDLTVPVTSEVLRGDPAAVISDVAESIDAGILIMGTHGKAGTAAFWENSVTARVLARTKRSMLLVPV
ncbi:universal stress protein [bacterium]|nr:universal stress protein [bacterium]